jgi:hypothetical protein
MFLYGRSQHPGAVQDETEHIEVAYHDNLQQLTQIAGNLKSSGPIATQQQLAAGELTLLCLAVLRLFRGSQHASAAPARAGGIRHDPAVRMHWADDAPRSSPSPEAADGVAAAGQGVWSLQHLTQAAMFGDERQSAPEAPSVQNHGAQQHSKQVCHGWLQQYLNSLSTFRWPSESAG